MKSWWLKTPDNFIFLDTEGQDILREIALVDDHGNLIYQAFVKDHYNNTNIRVNLKSLTKIIFNQLVVSNPQFKFTLFRDSRESEITGKVGKLEIQKLNNTKNGKFIIFEQENRINFELIYNFIIDIQEQNLELKLNDSLQFLPDYFTDYWLTSLIKS